jgi:hypothetical protein
LFFRCFFAVSSYNYPLPSVQKGTKIAVPDNCPKPPY